MIWSSRLSSMRWISLLEDAIGEFMYQKKLYFPLDGISKKLESMSTEEWEVLDRMTLSLIRLLLLSSVAFNSENEKINVSLMTALTKIYEKPSASNKVFLMKRLFNMKMIDRSLIVEYLSNFNTMTS